MGLALTLLIFCLVVGFHELGHFLFAKLFGISVERFSIGFGPVLLSKKFRGTEYCLSALPLGGYVQLYEGEKDGSVAPGKTSFKTAKLWQKVVTFAVGPAFNLLFAAILTVGAVIGYGIPEYSTRVGQVAEGSPAQAAGLKAGDRIDRVNGVSVRNWEELVQTLGSQPTDRPIELQLNRDGAEKTLSVTPNSESGKPRIGIAVGMPDRRPVGAAKAVQMGSQLTWENFVRVSGAFRDLLTGKLAVKENLGGPVRIMEAGSQHYDQGGLEGILIFAIMLSLNLAVLNFIPIPPLDGGHVLCFLLTGLLGERLGTKVHQAVATSGVALVLLLFLFLMWNDLSAILTR